MRSLRTLSAAALTLGLALGCEQSSESDSASTPATTDASDGTDGSDGIGSDGSDGTDGIGSDGSDGSDGTGAATACDGAAPKATGLVTTSAGFVVYNGQPVAVRASHDKSKYCVNTLGLDFAIDGGCKLSLEFTTLTGAWLLDKASLEGGPTCAAGWNPDDSVKYESDDASDDYAPASLAGAAKVVAGSDSQACSPTQRLELLGKVDLIHRGPTHQDDRYMTVDLNGLEVTGAFESAASTLSGCPATPATCLGLSCGTDYFGVDCGSCDKGTTCISGSCVEGGCKEGAPGDAIVGSSVGDQIYVDENGNDFNLHSLCGAPAVWMIRVAHWCSACTYLAPEFQRQYDEYSKYGVKFVLLVGENNSGGAATAADAASYKVKRGYQDGWIMLADPHWALTDNIIRSTSNGIPSHIILDGDLVLRQASTNTSSAWAEETALLILLKRQGLIP